MDEYIRTLPPIIGVNEVQKVLGVCKDTAYKIVNQESFPKLPVKKPIRISRDAFLRWAGIMED